MNIQLELGNFYMLDWLDQYLMGHKGFICGGCFKNIFNKEKVKDLDIFFESEKDWAEAVIYFDSQTKGYGFEGDCVTDETAKYAFLYENKKVKAYKNLKTNVRVELCRAVFGKPEQVISEFDFTITKFAYYKEQVTDEDTKEISIKSCAVCNEKFFEHLHLKRLVIDDKIPFPMSTFERVLRYAKYGFFPCKETKLKLARTIHDLSTERIEVSESLYDGMD